jgi:hypothetical protein
MKFIKKTVGEYKKLPQEEEATRTNFANFSYVPQ